MKTMKARAVYGATARPTGLVVEGLDGTYYYALLHPRETLLDRLKKCDQGWAATAEKMAVCAFEAWHFYRIEILCTGTGFYLSKRADLHLLKNPLKKERKETK